MTDGPWTYRKYQHGWIVDGAKIDSLATVCDDEADARLIAAAPELLGALRAMVDQVLNYESMNNLSPSPGRKYCWYATERAVAAIEAATGESQNGG